jgi:high-affinity iron transporter
MCKCIFDGYSAQKGKLYHYTVIIVPFINSFSVALIRRFLFAMRIFSQYEGFMKKLALLLSISFLFISSTSFGEESKPTPDLVVHLLDYLAKDYGGAVQNGKVVSESEYKEQVEFANIVARNATGVESLKADTAFSNDVTSLQQMIGAKASANDVAKLARKLQQDAIHLASIDVAPRRSPDLSNGGKLYQTNCTACHGNTGLGDGPAGKGLDPAPANFHDADLVWNSAPYKFYNTIRLGVPGTGMVAFTQLSDKEIWDLAFYLKSLPFREKNHAVVPAKLSLKDAAAMTDQEIAASLGGETAEIKAAIASLRAIGSVSENGNPLEIAVNFLNESETAAREGDYTKANDFALRAYLEGIEPLEPKMRANIPGFVEEIEALMITYRALIQKHESIGKIESQKKEVIGKLNEVKKVFAENKMSPGVAFGAAFSIFLREGFEAILIIVILISILRAMDQPEAIKWVHFGWIAAVAVGVGAWFGSAFLLSMSGLSRELMEGAISLLAVAVLVYVGFWLHRYSEMKRWRAFLEAKLKAGMTKGSYFALGLVAFMAVFREAFEVVLFLRAIWIDLDPSGQNVAGLGILASIAILIVLSYFAVKESKKLPLKMLFQVCSWTMIVLAVILIGKGVHSFQEAGFIGANPSGISLRVDLFGIYPTYQTVFAQLALVLLFAVLLFRDRKPVASEPT